MNAAIEPLPEFFGSFDGRGNIIYNIKLSEDGYTSEGLFSSLKGSVRNLHIVGGELTSSHDSANVGAICGTLDGGEIVNCSVSELDIAATGSGSSVGGLVGKASGKINSCSAIFGSMVSGENGFAGGIAGQVSEADITACHTAGNFLASGGIIGGIVSSGIGTISQCYSECSEGYVSGADVYGISGSGVAVSQAYYVQENCWLAKDWDRSVPQSELSVPGLSPAEREFAGREYLDSLLKPESVSKGTTLTRFGGHPEPFQKGVIGAVKATYTGGEFAVETLCGFDAYGNEMLFFRGDFVGFPHGKRDEVLPIPERFCRA